MLKNILPEKRLLEETAQNIRQDHPNLTASDLVKIARDSYGAVVVVSPLFIMSNWALRDSEGKEYMLVGGLTKDALQDQVAHELAHVIAGHNTRGFWRPGFIDDSLADYFSRQVNGYSRREQTKIRTKEWKSYLRWIHHDGDIHSQEEIDRVRLRLPDLWGTIRQEYVNSYIPA